MREKELKEILKLHEMWLHTKKGGARANLHDANLHDADLQDADLQDADLQDADLQDADLQDADLRRANLQGADLRGADLQGANLQGANLQGADIDYSCWPMWCGSLDIKVGRRIAAQLAYHFCRLNCDDPDYIEARNAVVNFANEFHRVDECGRLEHGEK